MPFEFAFLDWLQQFHNPVLDALAVFLNYAGEHGEIWIAFTLLLLLFRRTRKAGCAMATALVLYLVAGDCILKPLFARPRPCDVNTAITILVKRPHGHAYPSGHTASAFAAAFALWLQNRKLGVPALVLAAFIAFTRLYLYVHFPTDVLGGLVLGLALHHLIYAKIVITHFGGVWRVPTESIALVVLLVAVSCVLAVHGPARRIRNMPITATINEL